MSTLHSQILQSAEQRPEAPALKFSDATVSYSRFVEALRRLAEALQHLGIQKGDRAALLLPNVPHFPICYYAILSIGGIVVPLNFMNDPRDLARQLDDSGAKLLIAWQGFEPQTAAAVAAAKQCRTIIYLGEEIPAGTYSLTQLIAASKPLEKFVEVSPDEPAIINYTSGISDVALGAELTHEAVLANAETIIEMFHLTPQDRLLAVIPLFHPFGQTFIMHAGLTAGSSLVLLPRFKADEVVAAVSKHSITVFPAVPGMLRAICNLDNTAPSPSLKYVISYGGYLPQNLIEEFENRFQVPILKAYGLTEAGPLVSSSRLERDRRENAVGLPLMGVEVQIRDEEGRVKKPNQSGEIFVKSPSLMRSYHNQPEESRKRLQDGWLATGDIGYLDMDNYLYILERKDEIINKGGFEIFPREIETILCNFPGVAEAAVVGVPDPLHGSEVKACLVMQKGHRLDIQALNRYCEERLPVYKRPKYYECLEKLPKSPTGRVLKRLLRQQNSDCAAKRGGDETINL
ncbi:MAG: AMP-binding protein [candidate division KSB1 bacterium]|nr:AMP-binding protein [candidate division KSB1 bacterium]